MSGIKTTSGFNFYETLRYLLPGIFLIFLFGYFAFPSRVEKLNISEKLILSIVIGFIIHSFGMYKWVPGCTRLRKEYHENTNKILSEIDDVYMRWDTILLTISIDERLYFRKYFALGAFKLDMVFVMIIFLIYYIYEIIDNLLKTSFNSYIEYILNAKTLLIPLCTFLVIYVVRDDELNDLRRAFNISLITLLKYKKKENSKNQYKFLKIKKTYL